jgi:hypothetical protein
MAAFGESASTCRGAFYQGCLDRVAVKVEPCASFKGTRVLGHEYCELKDFEVVYRGKRGFTKAAFPKSFGCGTHAAWVHLPNAPMRQMHPGTVPGRHCACRAGAMSGWSSQLVTSSPASLAMI